MIRAMMKGPVYEEWFIPLIQGHYGGFELAMGHHLLGYYLISRRSKYRSGTRFYNRGIDENSKCSQFIETEQIMVLGNEISSFVSLSGSVPLFWEQKSQTDKIRLTRNKELTTLPFLEHLTNIRDEFSLILIVNLL
jgi:phosphatidylinositol-bisphosphatase